MITARWAWTVDVVVLTLFGAVGSAAAAAWVEQSLSDDYTLQATTQNAFQSTQGLLVSAQDHLRRAEGLAAYIDRSGTSPQRQQAAAALSAFRMAYDRLVEYCKSSPTDLPGQQRLWLSVRRGVRHVVMASPDLDFQQVVFFTVHARQPGNHPDCLVQNHDRPKERRPGGDILVQSGLTPDATVRPLIAGRLGRGHVEAMDLWWDADRLVFAYVVQPHWDDPRYQGCWGHVPWRPDNTASDRGMTHVVGMRDGVFWENGSEPTHLYEIALDGHRLRQLTADPLFCDREPAYLPDGDVVFSSDRGCGASQCGAAPLAYTDFGLPNLFRVSADGRRVERLTYNKDVDRYPHCLNDGLIGYMRWDYQERFWASPHSLWTIHPDGTMNDGLYKMHFASPQSVRGPRPIPGSRRVAVIATGHHAPPEGAVALVDAAAGANNPAALHYVTPRCDPLEGGLGTSPTVPEGGVPDRGGLYRTPWPLSEKSFLVAYAYPAPEKKYYAIYYIDVWGNKELIHRQPGMDALGPMPVRRRPHPPVLPSKVVPEQDYAVCYLDDVNRDMPGVAPATVRFLRISEALQWWFKKDDPRGPLRWTPGTQNRVENFGYWTWSPVRVVGTVPVEKDGSACFKVPTGIGLYFQALDENLMEIRRMRTHVEFKPGEARGCVGCHETKSYVPRGGIRLAFGREPSQPVPPPWGDRAILDYETMIQPIMERHCVGCHGAKEPKAGLDLTASHDPYGFMQSYRSLFGITRGQPTPLGDGYPEVFPDIPRRDKSEPVAFQALQQRIYQPDGLLSLSSHVSGTEITQPRQFGSHRSRLILTLLHGEAHRKDVTLRKSEWETLVTWVDANAPYHSTYFRYFDAQGKLLPRPVRVRIELDPPFKAGEKTMRVVGNGPAQRDVARSQPGGK
jgi:hypothetical protein